MRCPAESPPCYGSHRHNPRGSYAPYARRLEFRLEVSRIASPCSGSLSDDTSVSSAGRGEVAVGSEFIAESLKDPSEEDTLGWALAGLHMRVRRYNRLGSEVALKYNGSADTYDLTRGFPLGSHSSSV